MTLEELRARARQLHADAQAIIDAADNENDGILSDEQQQQYDTKIDELRKTNATIDRKVQQQANGQQLDASSGRRTQAEAPRNPAQPRDPNEDEFGFTSLGDFASAVRNASVPNGGQDQRLDAMLQAAPSNFHRETGSQDGYMVPPAFREQIWNMVFNEEDLLNAVSPEPTSSNSVELRADESTPWGASGIQAKWRDEGEQMTASRLNTEGRTVKLHQLYAFVMATDELVADAPRLTNRITRGAAQAIRWKASEAIMHGTGVGQPLGWMKSGALVSVAKEGSQSADTLVAENVAKMYARQLNPGRSIWYANSDIMPQLMTMTLGDQPIWTPPRDGFTGAPGGFLFGRPIRFTEHNPTLGEQGDLQFVDPQGYYAVRRGGLNFDSSIHLYFDYGIEAFRWTFRFGGQPFLSAPVAPAKGSNKKSHFVTLAERA